MTAQQVLGDFYMYVRNDQYSDFSQKSGPSDCWILGDHFSYNSHVEGQGSEQEWLG